MFWSKHGKEITLPFLISFSKHRSPFHYRGMLWFFFFFNKNTNSSWPEFCEQTVCQCPDHMLPSSSQNIVRSCLFVHMVWMDSWPRTYVVVIRAERRKQTWEPQKITRRDSRHKKSVLFIRKKWSWIARWPTYRDKQLYSEF